ncbi:MAG: thioredoxin [Spirochaetia bacterium]|jgi:thioredoxin 1|nr:thioredoxin [Spirochaetia bacterium]
MIKHTTTASFQDDVINSKVPVLVDFWAAWCGPCRMQGSILEKFDAKEDNSKFTICKVNVDEEGHLAQQFSVMSIPTLLVFKDGKVVQQAVGVRQEDALKSMLGL